MTKPTTTLEVVEVHEPAMTAIDEQRRFVHYTPERRSLRIAEPLTATFTAL